MIKLYRSKYEYDAVSFDNGETAIGLGIPVVATAGKLAASATPDYITLQPCLANEKDCIVHRINKDELYSMPLSAAGTSLEVGSAVTITTDGEATATTTAGNFKIEEFLGGKAVGDIVVGRFI